MPVRKPTGVGYLSQCIDVNRALACFVSWRQEGVLQKVVIVCDGELPDCRDVLTVVVFPYRIIRTKLLCVGCGGTKRTTRLPARKQPTKPWKLGTADAELEVRRSKCERRRTKVESECVEVSDGKGRGSSFVNMRFCAGTIVFLALLQLRTSAFALRFHSQCLRVSVVTHRALDSRSKCRGKFEEDARAFLAEANIDAQEDRFNGIEPKSKSHVAFQVFQVDVASAGCDLSNVSKDGHV